MSEQIKRKWVVVECHPSDPGSRDPKYWMDFDTFPEVAILREALERIAEEDVGATMGGAIGELHRLSLAIARDALAKVRGGGS